MAELLPCPFCGNHRIAVAVDNAAYSLGLSENTNFQTVCSVTSFGCGASSGWYETKEKAIQAWNRRAGEGK
jgi:Lar family restriction alleviation protein